MGLAILYIHLNVFFTLLLNQMIEFSSFLRTRSPTHIQTLPARSTHPSWLDVRQLFFSYFFSPFFQSKESEIDAFKYWHKLIDADVYISGWTALLFYYRGLILFIQYKKTVTSWIRNPWEQQKWKIPHRTRLCWCWIAPAYTSLLGNIYI